MWEDATPLSHLALDRPTESPLTSTASSIRTTVVTRLPYLLLWLAIAAYAALFAYLTIVRYAAFEARALDMGNLDQAIWNTAHGRWFHFTNQPGAINRLSLHVEPILLPIALLYWIRSGPPTLLLVQAVVVALGAWPVFALARHQLQRGWPALLLALAYLLNPALQAANWLEFHPITLAPTFLLTAFYFLVRGSNRRAGSNIQPASERHAPPAPDSATEDRLYTAAILLAASCKEEVGLLVAMIGLYAVLVLRRPRLGALTFLFGLGWSLLAVLVIQNLFAAGNIHWNRYAYLGAEPLQMVRTLLTQPAVLLAQWQAANGLTYLRQLLLPGGFVAVLAPEILLLGLPSLAINLLADFSPMHQVYTLIYAAPLVPFVWLATLFGITRIQRWSAIRPRLPTSGLIWGAVLLVLAGAFWAQWQHGYLPGGGNFRHYPITEHDRRGANIIAQISPTARVSAQDKLNPHVSSRETLYIFPRIEDADTVFVDVIGPAWPQHPNDLFVTIQSLHDSGWQVAAADHGYLLLQSADAAGATSTLTETTPGPAGLSMPAAFYDAWRAPDHEPATALQINFADTLRLIDYTVVEDAHNEVVVRLYWQLLQPLERPVHFYIAYADQSGNPLYDSLFYQPVAVLWYPISMWTPGTTVMVETLPWALEADHFSLSLGLFYADSDWDTGERLPITQAMPPRPILHNNSVVRLGGYRKTPAGWTAVSPTTVGPEQKFALRFGDHILLDGITVDDGNLSPAGDLTFTTFWQADAAIDFDYTIFAHLLDASGVTVAQTDWQPADAIGPRPFTSWLTGERIVDEQQLVLPADLDPGVYRLVVGLYNWQSGQRLAVQSTSGEDLVLELDWIEIENDAVVVAQFEMVE